MVKKIGSMSVFALAMLAFSACDDTSSASSDETDASSSSVESSDSDDSSSSVSEKSSSSDVKYSSSVKDNPISVDSKSSSSVKSSSSISVGSSSSSKKIDSSSSVVSSSSKIQSSSSSSSKDGESSSSKQNDSSSSKKEESSSSVYTPFDHSQTLAGAWRIGEDRYKTFTDPRNGRSYYYITITGTDTVREVASVTVMAENLNIGEMVPGENDQNDDSKIERYCYNNDTTNCDQFGGLYQWAEAMQLPSRCNTESCADLIQPNHQGICPDGWRLFNFNDYVIVINAEGNDDGVKGMRSTYGFSGTNSSGFSLTGAGKRTKKGGFDSLKENAYWYLPEEYEGMEETHAHFGVVSALTDRAPDRSRRDVKLYGLSVRCTKLEE